MANQIDMSLDVIIKSGKKRGDTQRAGGQRRGTFRGTQRAGGGVQRGKNRGGIQRSHKSAGHNALKHDIIFEGLGARKSVSTVRGTSASGVSHTKLLVSNLDFGVIDSDIQELFAEFGPLKNAAVHYDQSGRSLGTAHVTFERKGDAIVAMKQFNDVPLDGRPMRIQLAESEIPSIFSSGRLGGGDVKKTVQSQSRPHRSGGNRRSSHGGKQLQKKSPTTEELDAELDAYIKKRTKKPSTKEDLDAELDAYNKGRKPQKS